MNNFFRLYQKDKSSDSKVKFWQASNRCKRVLEAAKQKSPLLPRNLVLESFSELIIVFSTKIDLLYLLYSVSAIPPLFSDLEVLSSASDKTKLFAKNFSKNSNLDDSVISLPVFSSRTRLKLHNISVTPKMVKTVIMNLDLSMGSGPDCIPVVVLENCGPELSFVLAELFQIVGTFHQLSLYFRMLGKGLEPKTTILLIFFLWLVKSLRNL